MVGVRVIKADDIFPALAAFALDADQLAGINAIAVMGRVAARVAATHDRGDHALVVVDLPEQNATAFVGIGFFAVPAQRLIVRLANLQHCKIRFWTSASQTRYFTV